MSKPYYVRIKEIADPNNKYRVWKVHMLGDLSINYETGEMNILVWMVPLKKPESFKDGINHEQMVEDKNYDYYYSRQVKIGVGQLPLITPGTIFVDGYVYDRPRYITAQFDFTVTEDNQTIISSGSSWGKWDNRTRYYIPGKQFRLFDPHQSEKDSSRLKKPFPSKCLVVDFLPEEKPSTSHNMYPLINTEWKQEREGQISAESRSPKVSGLIIFCPEMIRFYYTFSSQTCQEVLSDGLAGTPNRLFKPQKTILPDANGRNGEIRLSKYVTDEDWRILVRPAFDPYALSEFRRPYISALKNKIADGLFLPEARFPFYDQKTKLTVHGTYLQTGNRIYFLVYWIECCTADFPYIDVKYSRDNPGGQGKDKDGQGEEFDDPYLKFDYEKQHEEQKRFLSASDSDGIDMQGDAPPGRFRDKIKLLLQEKERFKYVEDHPAEKIKTETNGSEEPELPVSPIFINIDEEMESGGTAHPIGARPITPATFVPNTDKTPNSNWSTREITEPPLNETPICQLPPEDKEQKLERTDITQESDDKSNGALKKLPISLDVFKKILNALKNNEHILETFFEKEEEIKNIYRKNLKAEMITISASGKIETTSAATKFPSIKTNSTINEKRSIPSEIFIAEISYIDGKRHAYLFDIEAKKGEAGSKPRGYKMFLCFTAPKDKKFDGSFLRDKILTICENYNANWEEASEEIKMLSQQDSVLKGFTHKHDLDSVEKYTARIIKTLYENIWILPEESW